MGTIDGKVAFITGAARGQGRSHAITLASEGASIIAVDRCAEDDHAPYSMGTEEDLRETVRLVEEAGGKILSRVADVRDLDALTQAANEGIDAFGRLDIVIANAGIVSYSPLIEMDPDTWQQMIDINLTGVWKTVRAAAPHIIEGGRGGSIVIISSTAGLKTYDSIGHYVAAKHGVTGLAKTLASELGSHHIRVNSIHPSNVNTPMLVNPGTLKMFRPDLDDPQVEDTLESFSAAHALRDLPWVEPQDISNAILYLVSESGRFVTGSQLSVDGGFMVK